MASRRTNGGQPAIKIACFGKHPGWDDHIEDIGLTTDLLVRAKRVMYTEGIGGNIDAGAWEKLDDAGRLAAFKHIFIWRTGDGLIIGRMWSSKDGKGRTKYPMIVAAQASGVHEGWAIATVLPKLEELEQRCVAATSSAAVKAAIIGVEASLKELTASAYAGNNSPTSMAGSEDRELLKRLTSSAELAVGSEGDGSASQPEGLLRVLYEVDRELAMYRPGTKATRMGALAPHQLRVPKGVPGVGEAPRAWTALLDQELMPDTPMLFIEPLDQPFLDIIVGDPAPASFFCVRCSRQGLPLTTEVPYTIEGLFRADAGAKIVAWQRGQPTDKASKPAKSKPEAAPSKGLGAAAGGVEGAPKSKMPLFVGLGVAVVVIIGIAYIFSGSSAKSGGVPSGGTPSGGTTPKADSASATGSSGSLASADPAKPESKTETKPETKPEGKAVTTPPTTPPAETKVAKVSESKPVVSPPPVQQAAEPPKVEVPAGTDPRPTWDVSARIARAKDELSGLNSELKAEGQPELTAIAQDLENATKRSKIARDMAWSSANAAAVTKEVGSVDQLVEGARKALVSARADLQGRVAAWIAAQPAPSATPVVAQTWKSVLATVDPAAGWAAAKTKVAELDSTMRKVDSAIAGLPSLTLPAVEGLDASSIVKLDDERKAQAARLAVEAALKSPAGAERGILEAVAPYTAWSAHVRDAITATSQLDALLRDGRPVDEAVDGRSIKSLVSAISSSPAFGDVGGAVKPVMDRAQSVASGADPIATLRKGVAPGEFSAWTTAVSNAAASGWPATDADFLSAGEVFGKASESLAGSSASPARKQELGGALRSFASAAWMNYAKARGNSDEGITNLSAGVAGWKLDGFTPLAMPAAIAFNVQRQKLARALADAGKGAEGVKKQRDAVATFSQAVAAMPDDIKNSVPAKAILASLAAPVAAGAASTDLSTLGPGSAGWTLAQGEDLAVATYTKALAGTTHTLTFRRVQADGGGGGGGDASFVCTNEVSLGLFADAVSAAGKWTEFASLLPSMIEEDARRGARVWEKSGDGIAPAKPAPPDTSQGWLRVRPNMAGKPYYPAGVKVEPPTRALPMQYSPPQAAVAMAKLAGCRIPTSAEWRAANAESPTTNPNLRDATYAAQMDHLVQFTNLNPEYPAAGIFVPKDVQRTSAAKDTAPAVQGDDATLWFVPAGEGSPTFANLTGNVAEFVVESGSSLDGLGDLSKASIDTALGRGDGLRVVGGSALSPKSTPIDVPQAVAYSQASGGYSDVGFRLAFSAPKNAGSGIDVARVKAAVDSAGYLSIGGAGVDGGGGKK